MIKIGYRTHRFVFKSLKTICLLGTMLLFAFSQQIHAQSFSVSGTVSDNLGTVPGVSILLKGSTAGTLTNVNGEYKIDVPDRNGVLVFTFMGYSKQEVPINGRNIVNVILKEDVQSLDEVVVTALGLKRAEKSLGYAMTEVKGDELSKLNTVNPIQSLQGKSAGLSIGSSDGGLFGNTKIQLRGISVLNSKNNQPIFVVDGVILENSVSNESADWGSSANDFGNQLKNLNPDDFESVSVLKGAAATALYGSRGVNGAIIIKTKDGSGTRGIGINVSQSVGFDHVYGTPDFQHIYGPGPVAGDVNYGEKDANGNYYRFSPMNQFYANSDGIPTKIGFPSSRSYGPKYDGRQMEDFDRSMTTYSPFTHNMLDAFNTGINTNTSISLTGGNDKGTFYLSDSYNHRKGITPGNEFTRNALLFSGSYNLAKWLKAEASIAFTTSTPKNPISDLSQNFVMGTFQGWYDTKKWNRKDIYEAPHGGAPSKDYGDKYAYVPGNTKWYEIHNNSNERREQVVRPMARLTAKLADWISVTAEGNMNSYTIESEIKKLGTGYAKDGGEYSLRNETDVSRTGKIAASMTKTWNTDWSSNLLVGGELWDQRKEYTFVRTDGGLIVPGQYFLDNSKKTNVSEGTVNSTKQINSFYFLFATAWKDQVFLDITGRNDWSSALVYTNGTGNYSYFYPSVSASWLFNETLKLPEWVTFGKLRLSWAQVGNDTDPYFLNKGYEIGKMELSGSRYDYLISRSTTLMDPNIKPERKKSYEAGLDLRLFNNRIGIDFAAFDETINNQIGSIPLAVESGYKEMFTNIATMKVSGIELTLRGVPVKTRDFQWETTFNYWKNKSKISNMRPEAGEYKVLGGDISYGNFRVGSVAYNGGEYGVLMSDTKPLEWKSDDPNDPRNGMKVLTWDEDYRGAYYTRSYKAEEVGKIQPKFEGSLNNTFTYKGLTLQVLIDARFGGHIASFTSKYGTAYGYLEASLFARDKEHGGIGWASQYDDTKGQSFQDGVIPDGVFKQGQMVTSPDGTKVDVGGMTYKEAFEKGYVEPTHASYYTFHNNEWGTGVVNSDWLAEVKYVALRNISLSYRIPKHIAGRLKANNLVVAGNVNNLCYLYNSLPNHINPESFRGTATNDSFRERSFSPYVASYTFSVSLDF